MLWCTAALTPSGEMPQCCSQKGLGRSEPGGVFLGDVGNSRAEAGFSAVSAVDTCMAPKCQSETPCGSFPCVLTSGRCLLITALMLPAG